MDGHYTEQWFFKQVEELLSLLTKIVYVYGAYTLGMCDA